MSPPPPPPLTLTIHRVPPTSSICDRLASALQKECEDLYPDYRDFPFFGEGDWLNGPPTEIVKVDNDMTCWVAFVADGEDGERGESDLGLGVPVGCVGVRKLPFFPLHRVVETDAGQPGKGPELACAQPTAEIKRMFVDVSYRGRQDVDLCLVTSSDDPEVSENHSHDHNRNPKSAMTIAHEVHPSISIAALLLRQAETFAREQLGCRRVVLETGMRQYAAMALYRREGWARRADFGDYVGAGEDVGGLSRCWEKML